MEPDLNQFRNQLQMIGKKLIDNLNEAIHDS